MNRALQKVTLMCFFIFQNHCQTIFPPAGLTQEKVIALIQEKKKSKNIEFAFDIHKVLIHKLPRSQWKVFWNSPHKSKLLRCFGNISLFRNLCSMLGQLIINNLPWHSKRYKEVTSNQLIGTFIKADQPELAQLFTAIVNTQAVDPEMKALIIELKKAGYTLHVASNIGKPTYLNLKERLEILNNNIFAYFDKDSDGMEGKTIDEMMSTAQKPEAEYYQEYMQKYNPDGANLVIFIDDKLVNIYPGVDQKMLGIHFTNAQQLRDDLKSLMLV